MERQIDEMPDLSKIYFIFLSVFILFYSQPILANEINEDENFVVFTMNNDLKDISKSRVRMLYRGKTKSISGKRVELSDWPSDTEQREEFYKNLLGKTPAQMNSYWASMSFSGKARPPKELSHSDIGTLIEWLQEKNNRIGYAPQSLVPSDVNILYVLKAGAN
ncbi:hypothetical protein L0B53_14100 [Vibrio sp. SS-MA-C1-2]|uniref:hypothetical protein n=1 Tax=Vibrio sp. SS-MA-C1-2 TaxID=2908646 RepID=UPI001F315380|nr:hypothetical protein [Vibrio sp. SS-MA-C1-2]UJF18143.1 hypothetical protein L0B53_14100 [Vibrio sp. SS-MA-C1-2]